MGLDTLIVELSALWVDISRNLHFPVIDALICIKNVRAYEGQFCNFKKIAYIFFSPPFNFN